jgi:DTW domain-containing protein
MRSHTASDLPGRCPRCWIRLEFCVCTVTPTVATVTRVLVVRHERESWKSTGTARVAQLALPNFEFVDYGDDPNEANARLPELQGGVVLFPSEQPAPWPSTPPSVLVVLDGTWRQTRRMASRLPKLSALPKVQLTTAPRRMLRLRDTTFDEGRSTLEAIADALELLEGPHVAAPLHRLHADYVERVFKARGVWEQKKEAFERSRQFPYVE